MGEISYFNDEDIQVKDWEGLVKFFKWWDKYVTNKKEPDYLLSEKMLNKKEKTLTFEKWDDIKLISYFYDIQLIFLELVSEFIEGGVEWDFESKDETGSVNFSNGTCEITTGEMTYTTGKPEENIRDLEHLDKEIKRRLVLRNLKC
jgi:hypothetical protein